MNAYNPLDVASASKSLQCPSASLSTPTDGITLEQSTEIQLSVVPSCNGSIDNNVATVSVPPPPPQSSLPLIETRTMDLTETAIPATAPASVAVLKEMADPMAVGGTAMVDTPTQPETSLPIMRNMLPTPSASVSSAPSTIAGLAESVVASTRIATFAPISSETLTESTNPIHSDDPTTSTIPSIPAAITSSASPTTNTDPHFKSPPTTSTIPAISAPAAVPTVVGPRATKTVTVETERHTVRLVEDGVLPNSSATPTLKDTSSGKITSEAVRQAYVFLSESNRQELRKIARRWNCPQGFTKGILVAKLVMFVYERVEKLKACKVRDVLGAVEAWGFDAFLAQWENVHSKKSVANLDTLERLAKSNSKLEADAVLPELPRVDGKRKWRKTRLRERERAAPNIAISCAEPIAKRRVGRPPKSGVKLAALATATKTMFNVTSNEMGGPVAQDTNGSLRTAHNPNIPSPTTKSLNRLISPALPIAERESASLEKVQEKLEEVSDQVAQFMSSKPTDTDHALSHKEAARTNVSSTETSFEMERKLILELKEAKRQLVNAKGDEELENRWSNLADRIRKKLDTLSTIGLGG